ncbi:MAG TPA: phosphoglycerate dehydrogenase [Rhodothermales bacterium]
MPDTVLITDSVDPVCIEMLENNGVRANVQLKKSPEELQALAASAEGWIIRSGTKITSALIEAGPRLKVIGRAGVGVDNVDVEAATRKGILVINAPDGNTISTAEHTCAMLMALARRIPQANHSVRDGKWDRKTFTGSEVFEKTLGVVGVGKIGRAVAERMKGFGMKIIGYDPVLGDDVARRIGLELVPLEEIFAQSDFITIHTPLNDATRGLLNRETIARCRKGVRIVNCARGGIVDEEALYEALESGHVGGAALDVYSQEPPPESLQKLLQHPLVVATPHIAASTEEAQEKVARQVTEQVILALKGEPVATPVNGLAIKMASQKEVQPFLNLADRLGQIAGQLSDGHIKRITVRCSGELTRQYAEVLTIGAVKGVLSRWTSEPVNLINAPFLAEELGLRVEERRETVRGNYVNVIEVSVESETDRRTVAGTIFGADDMRLVRIDDFWIEVRPEGHLLLYRNVDRPGMLASVGSILAEANINIGALALGRTGKGSMALTAVSVDERIPESVLERIAALQGVESVRFVSV